MFMARVLEHGKQFQLPYKTSFGMRFWCFRRCETPIRDSLRVKSPRMETSLKLLANYSSSYFIRPNLWRKFINRLICRFSYLGRQFFLVWFENIWWFYSFIGVERTYWTWASSVCDIFWVSYIKWSKKFVEWVCDPIAVVHDNSSKNCLSIRWFNL